jgi:hypothetical protein
MNVWNPAPGFCYPERVEGARMRKRRKKPSPLPMLTEEDIENLQRLFASLQPGAEQIRDLGTDPICLRTWEFAKWYYSAPWRFLGKRNPKITREYLYQMHRDPLRRSNFKTTEYRRFLKAKSEGSV